MEISDEWTHDNYEVDNNKEVVNNWSIGTYVRVRPPKKKTKGNTIINNNNTIINNNNNTIINNNNTIITTINNNNTTINNNNTIITIVSIDYNIKEYNIDSDQERSIIDLDIPPDADPGLVHNNITGNLQFDFDKVFDINATQDNVFDNVARKKISNVLEGNFSYYYHYQLLLII